MWKVGRSLGTDALHGAGGDALYVFFLGLFFFFFFKCFFLVFCCFFGLFLLCCFVVFLVFLVGFWIMFGCFLDGFVVFLKVFDVSLWGLGFPCEVVQGFSKVFIGFSFHRCSSESIWE